MSLKRLQNKLDREAIDQLREEVARLKKDVTIYNTDLMQQTNIVIFIKTY